MGKEEEDNAYDVSAAVAKGTYLRSMNYVTKKHMLTAKILSLCKL